MTGDFSQQRRVTVSEGDWKNVDIIGAAGSGELNETIFIPHAGGMLAVCEEKYFPDSAGRGAPKSVLVRERKWHPTQQLQELAGGKLRLTLRLSNLPEIERWVLSWGAHATVIRPDALRNSLRKVAGELNERYQAAGASAVRAEAAGQGALTLF